MNTPLINIITRTRNRPNYFKRCVESLNLQTYNNIHHIVTYQVEEDLEYINNFGFNNTTPVKVPNIIKDESLFNMIEGHKVYHAPYNSFFNEAHKYIKEGWVMYLDDDDMLTFANTIEKLVEEINNYDMDTKHLWRVQFPTYLIPHDKEFNEYKNGSPLKCCQISAIGLMYHSNHLDKINFHEWSLGDYFAFKGLDEKLPKRNMINHPLTRLQTQPGFGKRQDYNL